MREVTYANVDAALKAAGVPFSYDLEVKDSWDKKGKIASVEINYHDITFDDLTMVSKALGTSKINLDSQTREGGYCETCRYSYTVTVLTVMDIQIPDEYEDQ